MTGQTTTSQADSGIVSSAKAEIGRDFTTMTWVLLPIGIGINAVGSVIVNALRLPLHLDVIGTVLIAILAGPWAAALTGLFTQVVNSMLGNPVLLAFIPVSVAIGLAAGYLARWGYFSTLRKSLVPAVVLTAIAVLVSTPIVVLVFGGVTGSGADLVTGAVMATGQNLVESVLAGNIVVETVDKVATVFIAYLIGRSVPVQFLPPQGQNVYSK